MYQPEAFKNALYLSQPLRGIGHISGWLQSKAKAKADMVTLLFVKNDLSAVIWAITASRSLIFISSSFRITMFPQSKTPHVWLTHIKWKGMWFKLSVAAIRSSIDLHSQMTEKATTKAMYSVLGLSHYSGPSRDTKKATTVARRAKQQ